MPDDPIPYGYCQCGCGEKTRVAVANDKRSGEVKGEPVRYRKAHHHRGKIVSAETRAKLSMAVSAAKPGWKGHDVSYGTLHQYLRRWYPKLGICDECGDEKRTSYALRHGREYTREREDYRELCHACHMRYDLGGVPLSAEHRAKISAAKRRK